jgi:hypothetical protein
VHRYSSSSHCVKELSVFLQPHHSSPSLFLLPTTPFHATHLLLYCFPTSTPLLPHSMATKIEHGIDVSHLHLTPHPEQVCARFVRYESVVCQPNNLSYCSALDRLGCWTRQTATHRRRTRWRQKALQTKRTHKP